jgi:Ca2+/H+ antiporter, TMEM165/GDT1 family
MRHSRFSFPKFLMIILFVFAFIVPISFIVMALWNNILVPVLHVALINFWQALGIFALSKILFGGFPGKPGWGGRGFRRREMEDMRNKWFGLSPEEKERFKADWKNRCGRGPVSAATEGATTE